MTIQAEYFEDIWFILTETLYGCGKDGLSTVMYKLSTVMPNYIFFFIQVHFYEEPFLVRHFLLRI
jgi:hypothetical protein